MAREVVCPQCGSRLPIDPNDEPAAGPALDTARTVEAVLPQTVSIDEFGLASPAPVAIHAGSSANGQTSPTLGSGAFPTIDFDAPGSPTPAAGGDDPGEWIEPRRGTPWAVVLLGSYASAMTLAFAWLWWQGGRSGPAPDAVASLSPVDPGAGRREQHSEKVAPSEPIPPERTTILGRPLRVGELEITPLSLRVGRVELERTPLDGSYEMRDGGEGALYLEVRLRNLSDDQVFAPLDEAFLRDPDRGVPDSFLESRHGERIYLYPLPRESEWSILGQSFRELRPGEALETVIVSDRDAFARMVGPMTWRLKLRSGADAGSTALIGVDVDRDRVQ